MGGWFTTFNRSKRRGEGRQIEIKLIQKTSSEMILESLDDEYDVDQTAQFLASSGYSVIAAQFPDSLLSVAPEIACRLKNKCRDIGHDIEVYVLADTTYNSLSVDEVASSHIHAQCIVHYGRASLTDVSRTPAYHVFPKDKIEVDGDLDDVLDRVKQWQGTLGATLPHGSEKDTLPDASEIVVFIDQVYAYRFNDVMTKIQCSLAGRHVICPSLVGFMDPLHGARADQKDASAQDNIDCSCSSSHCKPQSTNRKSGHNIAGYDWDGVVRPNTAFLWFGSADAPAREQLMLTYNAHGWLSVDPSNGMVEEGIPRHVLATLRKRYYLVEKARESSIVGIVVGTLGAEGYKDSVDSLRLAAKRAGKKSYTLLMGKPNPAKLANFPEIEVFVLVADPQGQILDCKEYLAPIITPYEAHIAFSPDKVWEQHLYRLDIKFGIRDSSINLECKDVESISSEMVTRELAIQAQEALTITPASQHGKEIAILSSADYLVHKRTWKGVDAPFAGSEEKDISKVEKGQHGRAAAYTHEMHE
jgi:diphthamide biosynthesis protein 2